jgi:hypothetical protein
MNVLPVIWTALPVDDSAVALIEMGLRSGRGSTQEMQRLFSNIYIPPRSKTGRPQETAYVNIQNDHYWDNDGDASRTPTYRQEVSRRKSMRQCYINELRTLLRHLIVSRNEDLFRRAGLRRLMIFTIEGMQDCAKLRLSELRGTVSTGRFYQLSFEIDIELSGYQAVYTVAIL